MHKATIHVRPLECNQLVCKHLEWNYDVGRIYLETIMIGMLALLQYSTKLTKPLSTSTSAANIRNKTSGEDHGKKPSTFAAVAKGISSQHGPSHTLQQLFTLLH